MQIQGDHQDLPTLRDAQGYYSAIVTKHGSYSPWEILFFVMMLITALLIIDSPPSAFDTVSQQRDLSLIVQVEPDNATALSDLVTRLGGHVTHELTIINAFGVEIPGGQADALQTSPLTKMMWHDQQTTIAGRPQPDTAYPTLIGAEQLHDQGILGSGIGVAVVDTGSWSQKALNTGIDNDYRLVAEYDAINNTTSGYINDESGHGTHVSSIILSSDMTGNKHSGKYNGIAPDADLIKVKAFDADGQGSYLDIIRGIDWVVANSSLYNIRVMNLSFSAPPQSYYWDDPLNLAVMRAWQAGIVVVAAAGNRGPDPMSIGAPGNVPYIITVGAFTDSYTALDPDDDRLATFSATGPTVEGFVKPDLVAPGGHIRAMMDGNTTIAIAHPDYHYDGSLFVMSGTSQAAAVTSGVVALMLQADPTLSPDQVKCRLMASARPAVTTDNQLAYSVFQQGAGQINAFRAVNSQADDCANQGIDISLDLAGTQHYGGRANQDAEGNYYIPGVDGYAWSGGYAWGDNYAWSDGYAWGDNYAWSDGYAWGDNYAWSDGYAWGDNYAWSDNADLAASMSTINQWVPQE